jgi:hypothetical protein
VLNIDNLIRRNAVGQESPYSASGGDDVSVAIAYLMQLSDFDSPTGAYLQARTWKGRFRFSASGNIIRSRRYLVDGAMTGSPEDAVSSVTIMSLAAADCCILGGQSWLFLIAFCATRRRFRVDCKFFSKMLLLLEVSHRNCQRIEEGQSST